MHRLREQPRMFDLPAERRGERLGRGMGPGEFCVLSGLGLADQVAKQRRSQPQDSVLEVLRLLSRERERRELEELGRSLGELGIPRH